MSTNDDNTLHAEIRRIVVAVDTQRTAHAAIETAARFAARWHAELAALFVEDEDLLNIAALPFTREVSPLEPGGREIGTADMAAALMRDADRVAQAVRASAAKSGLAHSFTVVRGRLLRHVLANRRADELVIVSEQATLESVRFEPTHRGTLARTRGPRILAIADAPRAAARCRAIAAELAGPAGEVIVLAAAAIGPPACDEAAAFGEPHPTVRHLVHPRPWTAELLARLLDEYRPAALVIAPDPHQGDASAIARVLNRALCRVVLSP